MASRLAIGIDLGTTFSCVAVCQKGKVDIIANEVGNRLTPSFVSFTATERLVGELAKPQLDSNPHNTIFDVKRLMGRQFHDATVQKIVKSLPYEVIEENGLPRIVINYKGDRKVYSPEEISAMILFKMKETAEAFLGQRVSNAVITVPSYFNDAQRKATKVAGTMAGLNVLRLLNEPTAAALAYGLNRKNAMRKVLVFDMGAGALNLTVLFIDKTLLSVKASAGSRSLGGVDIDNRLLHYMIDEFQRKHKKTLNRHPRAIQRMRIACERAKRTLSAFTHANITIESLAYGIDYHFTISRARFEEINTQLFRSAISMVSDLLRDTHIDKHAIDDIVLVGGSTRIPKLQLLLQNFFDGKELCKSIEPDETVAYGAAVHAAFMSGGYHVQALFNMLILDVLPLSLGIATSDGSMHMIIKRNTTLPIRQTRVFTTASDNQTSALIGIYQGERARAKDNLLLAQLQLSGIPPAPFGIPQIEVTFDIDTNCVVHVSAVEKSTRISSKLTIRKDIFELSKSQIEHILHDAQMHHDSDEIHRNCYASKYALQAYSFQLKHIMLEPYFVSHLAQNDRERVIKKCNEVVSWLSAIKSAPKKAYDIKKRELDLFCRPLLTYMYQNNMQPLNCPTYNPQLPGIVDTDAQNY